MNDVAILEQLVDRPVMPAADFRKLVVPLPGFAGHCGFTGLQQQIRHAAHRGDHDDRPGLTHRLNDARSLIDLRNSAYGGPTKLDDNHRR